MDEARSGTEGLAVTVTVVHGPLAFGNYWVIGRGGKFHRGPATSRYVPVRESRPMAILLPAPVE